MTVTSMSVWPRQIAVMPFPFSDLSAQKLRPALVLADAGRGDWLLCQITSRSYGDGRAIALDAADFVSGGLRIASHARPAKLFTAHETLLRGVVGELSADAHRRVVDAIVQILREPAG